MEMNDERLTYFDTHMPCSEEEQAGLTRPGVSSEAAHDIQENVRESPTLHRMWDMYEEIEPIAGTDELFFGVRDFMDAGDVGVNVTPALEVVGGLTIFPGWTVERFLTWASLAMVWLVIVGFAIRKAIAIVFAGGGK